MARHVISAFGGVATGAGAGATAAAGKGALARTRSLVSTGFAVGARVSGLAAVIRITVARETTARAGARAKARDVSRCNKTNHSFVTRDQRALLKSVAKPVDSGAYTRAGPYTTAEREC